jgi:bacillithiol biosynthesis deacetylase BshB1
MKLDILAFGAHPDDAELGAGGSLSKAVATGSKVGIIDLTRGELGTRGTPELRSQEAHRAAKIIGVFIRENLGFADGFFENSKVNQLKVIEKIRHYQPDVVFCNAIEDRHIDHARGSELVSNACFLSGLVKIDTYDEEGNPQSSWRPKQVLHYIQWQEIEPQLCLDISGYLDIKMKAVEAYASQFFDPSSVAPETPISNQNFIDSVAYRAKNLGRLIGVEAAEGFTVEKLIAVDSVANLL